MDTAEKIKDLKVQDQLSDLLLEYTNLNHEDYLKLLFQLENQGIKIPLACIGGKEGLNKLLATLDSKIIDQELGFLISAQFNHNFSPKLEPASSVNFFLFYGDKLEVSLEDYSFTFDVVKRDKYIQRYLYLTDSKSKHVTYMRIKLLSSGEHRLAFEEQDRDVNYHKNFILPKIKESVGYYLTYCFDNYGYIFKDCLLAVEQISKAYQISIKGYPDIAVFNNSENLSDFGIKDVSLLSTMSNLIRSRDKKVFLLNSHDLTNYLKQCRRSRYPWLQDCAK